MYLWFSKGERKCIIFYFPSTLLPCKINKGPSNKVSRGLCATTENVNAHLFINLHSLSRTIQNAAPKSFHHAQAHASIHSSRLPVARLQRCGHLCILASNTDFTRELSNSLASKTALFSYPLGLLQQYTFTIHRQFEYSLAL